MDLSEPRLGDQSHPAQQRSTWSHDACQTLSLELLTNDGRSADTREAMLDVKPAREAPALGQGTAGLVEDPISTRAIETADLLSLGPSMFQFRKNR